MDIGNIITLLTLMLTIILGISDIRRRRSEANKMDAEGKLSEVSADTQLMSQIKQASIDLMLQLKQDNEDLRVENDDLKSQVSYYRKLLRESNIPFSNFETRRLNKEEK